MALITEANLKAKFKNKYPKKISFENTDIITPSARDFLVKNKIEIVSEEELLKEIKEEVKDNAPKFKYICHETKAYYLDKPEHMTHIKGNELVFKNHKRIVFRGKIDSFMADVIHTIQQLEKLNYKSSKDGLIEVLKLVKSIQRCEVLNEELEEFKFLGMDEAKQREVSHNPKKYFRTNHLFDIDERTNESAVMLNVLRTKARELEIAAIDAYFDGRSIERQDMLKAMNRLSSCIYILMLKAVS